MGEKIERVLITNCKTNSNGWRFSGESLESFVENNKEKPIFGKIGMVDAGGNLDLTEVSHYADNFSYEDGNLYADVTILDTPKGNVLKENIESVSFRTASIGTLEDKILSDFEIISINAIDKSEDALDFCGQTSARHK